MLSQLCIPDPGFDLEPYRWFILANLRLVGKCPPKLAFFCLGRGVNLFLAGRASRPPSVSYMYLVEHFNADGVMIYPAK